MWLKELNLNSIQDLSGIRIVGTLLMNLMCKHRRCVNIFRLRMNRPFHGFRPPFCWVGKKIKERLPSPIQILLKSARGAESTVRFRRFLQVCESKQYRSLEPTEVSVFSSRLVNISSIRWKSGQLWTKSPHLDSHLFLGLNSLHGRFGHFFYLHFVFTSSLLCVYMRVDRFRQRETDVKVFLVNLRVTACTPIYKVAVFGVIQLTPSTQLHFEQACDGVTITTWRNFISCNSGLWILG